MDINHQRPDDDTPTPSEGIPAPEGAANLIDTDYVIGQDNITASPIGFNIDLHGKVFTISSLLIVLFVVLTLALEGTIAIALLLGGGLTALQTMAVSTGFPFTLILLIACYAIVKGLMSEPKAV